MTRLGRAVAWAEVQLASRRIALGASLVGLLLSAVALTGGLQTEDWVFRSLVRSGELALPERLNLWEPPTPPPEALQAGAVHGQMNLGLLPWITSPHFDITFWRPLSSLTHQIDYLFWPEAAWLMHAENLVVYGLLVLAVAALYRRLIAPLWAAGLAALLYAIDDAHGQPIGWISNRNALLAAGFAVLALWAHDRGRREAWRAGVVLAPVSLAFALASGEGGLGIAGYFVAHALFVDRGSAARRALAALPWLVVVAGWAVVYRALDYGASGSGLYNDPWAEPLQFLSAAPSRAVALLLGLFAAPPSDLWAELERTRVPWAAALGGGFLLLLGTALAPWLRRDAHARFWGAGCLLSLVPACATFPEDRMLLLPGLGGMALIAGFVAHVVESRQRLRFQRLVAALFVLLHGVVAPILLPYRVLTMDRYDARLAAARESAFSVVTPEKELIVVNAPDFYFGTMLLLTRMARDEPLPARQLCLAGTLGEIVLHRPNPTTLEVVRPPGFLEEQLNRIYRAENERVARGDKVAFDGLEVEASRVDSRGEPTGVTFRFAKPLESADYVWVRWQGGRYVRFVPPAVGSVSALRGK